MRQPTGLENKAIASESAYLVGNYLCLFPSCDLQAFRRHVYVSEPGFGKALGNEVKGNGSSTQVARMSGDRALKGRCKPVGHI